MAAGPLRSLQIIIFGVCTIVSRAYAAPIVALPFNSQVPTVARVGQLYNFQFSPSSFAPEAVYYTYSLSNQPEWLSLDGATRTLSGIPSQADVGSADFTLTAASIDGAAHMACTLVVSKDPPPQMEGDLGEQLAATVNLSSGHPPWITVLASSPFHFQFKQGSFIDIVERKLYYYATLTDHTPLPSWLIFDAQSLTFSGFAPQLAASPQSWDIELIASDVDGFAGASASFTIAIGTQQLVFVPEQQVINITAGKSVKYTGLQETLFRGGVKMAPEDLGSANASVPPWLHLAPSTLALTGTAPEDVTDLNITVVVSDKTGNQASALIRLVAGSSTIFSGTVGVLTAHAGESFNYQFPTTLFTNSDVQVEVILPVTAKWLHFDAANRRLSGKVPARISPSLLEGKITGTSNATHESRTQTFTIKIVSSHTESTASHILATSTAAATPSTAVDKSGSHARLSSGVVAAVVLGCLLAAAILAACLVFLRRQKRRQNYVEPTSPTRRTISRPILSPEPDAITVTTELQNDIEKTAGGDMSGRLAKATECAPQIALNLPAPPPSKRFKWSKRFSRISHESSLGIGEEAVRADSNIPELGAASRELHNPHESFSVPAKMARSSKQLTELSPGKKALKRSQKKRQPSAQSIGLGIDTGAETTLPRHSSHGGRSHRRAGSSMGLSVATDRSSAASFSTRGTSVLSTKPSDFPRPPTRSTFGGFRSVPKSSLTEADKRRSIRLVDRSDSIADDRSLQEKRQSFIRNRASASFVSPLFAHGARGTSGGKQNGQMSLNGSSAADYRRSQRGNSQLTTYSESSSLEPPPRDPRRLSARVRSAFAPNYPRAVTKSTLGANNDGPFNDDTSSFYTTNSSISEKDYTAEMALPRNERSWVLPGEASPTPPPALPKSRQGSGTKKSTTTTFRGSKPKQKWQKRLREHSSSPLSTALAVSLAERNSLTNSARVSQARRSKISEPISLVSNDSLSRTRPERPRLVHANSKRPVSVEKVQRLSSFKAETEDARPGSEMFEALEEAGLMPPSVVDGKEASQKSNFSGPAFL